MEHEPYPYDWAYQKLGFFQPAIRVASSEGERQLFPWTKAFADDFDGRFNSYLQTIKASSVLGRGYIRIRAAWRRCGSSDMTPRAGRS